MDKARIKYYQLLARYIYLREEQDKSFDEDTKDMKRIDRSEFRTSDIPNTSFADSKPLPDDMPTPLAYKARTKVRQGERIVMHPEISEIENKLLSRLNPEESHITAIDLMKYKSTDLPPKHFRFINGYRRFLWDDIEFELNEYQAESLENIYNHFVETGSKYFIGKAFKHSTKRDIVKTFEGSDVIGTIILKVKQGEYEIDIDF